MHSDYGICTAPALGFLHCADYTMEQVAQPQQEAISHFIAFLPSFR